MSDRGRTGCYSGSRFPLLDEQSGNKRQWECSSNIKTPSAVADLGEHNFEYFLMKKDGEKSFGSVFLLNSQNIYIL